MKTKKIKRNKGKKFRYFNKDQQQQQQQQQKDKGLIIKESLFSQFAKSKQNIQKKNQEKRQNLITEYKNQKNKNEFRDNRLSKNERKEKLLKRFKKQILKQKGRNAKYLLSSDSQGDEDKLIFTHNNKSLDQIDQYNVLKEGEDQFDLSDQEEQEYRERQITKLIQFGEGGDDQDDADQQDQSKRRKSKKEKLQQLINKQKLQKNERLIEKEKNIAMTQKINSSVQEMLSLLQKRKSNTLEKQQQDQAQAYNKITMKLQEMGRKNATETQRQCKEQKKAIRLEREDFITQLNEKKLNKGSDQLQQDQKLPKNQRIKQEINRKYQDQKNHIQKSSMGILKNYLQDSDEDEDDDESNSQYMSDDSQSQDQTE